MIQDLQEKTSTQSTPAPSKQPPTALPPSSWPQRDPHLAASPPEGRHLFKRDEKKKAYLWWVSGSHCLDILPRMQAHHLLIVLTSNVNVPSFSSKQFSQQSIDYDNHLLSLYYTETYLLWVNTGSYTFQGPLIHGSLYFDLSQLDPKQLLPPARSSGCPRLWPLRARGSPPRRRAPGGWPPASYLLSRRAVGRPDPAGELFVWGGCLCGGGAKTKGMLRPKGKNFARATA